MFKQRVEYGLLTARTLFDKMGLDMVGEKRRKPNLLDLTKLSQQREPVEMVRHLFLSGKVPSSSLVNEKNSWQGESKLKLVRTYWISGYHDISNMAESGQYV